MIDIVLEKAGTPIGVPRLDETLRDLIADVEDGLTTRHSKPGPSYGAIAGSFERDLSTARS